MSPRGRSLITSLGVLLALASLSSVACGSRSGLDCFGESCEVRDGAGGTFSDGVGAAGSAGDVPGDDVPGDVDPPLPDPTPVEPTPVEPVDGISNCGTDGIFRGTFASSDPGDLRYLEGCHTIDGDLMIAGILAPDLRELRALQRVTGSFYLNASGSIDGLESLTAVGDLMLEWVDAPTLAAFGNLRQIGNANDGGTLIIKNLVVARDLSGLGAVETLRSLQVTQGGSLQSLEGLRVPPVMTSIDITDSLEFRDLSALLPLTDVETFKIRSNDIINLHGLENLARAGTLELAESNLTDISQLVSLRSAEELTLRSTGVPSLTGLEGLTEVGTLTLDGNRNLANTDPLHSLQRLDRLVVEGNPLLTQLPVFDAVASAEQVVVRANPALASAPFFPNIVALEFLSVIDNATLREVWGFHSLASADQIEILNNPALDTVALPALASSRNLQISCNAVLSQSSIDTLAATAENVTMFGNLGSAEPCPQ